MKKSLRPLAAAAMAIGVAAVSAASASASAPTGIYAPFKYCPYQNSALTGCLVSTTTSGSFKLGTATVPVSAPITLQGGIVRPASRGQITLTSADPTAPLHLDPATLSRQVDLDTLTFAVQLCREIGRQPALAEWKPTEVLPGPDVRDDAALRQYIRENVITYHHQVGTCRMGVDDRAVVRVGPVERHRPVLAVIGEQLVDRLPRQRLLGQPRHDEGLDAEPRRRVTPPAPPVAQRDGQRIALAGEQRRGERARRTDIIKQLAARDPARRHARPREPERLAQRGAANAAGQLRAVHT